MIVKIKIINHHIKLKKLQFSRKFLNKGNIASNVPTSVLLVVDVYNIEIILEFIVIYNFQPSRKVFLSSICLSVCLPVCLSARLFILLSVLLLT